jgi:hypothetical protein
MHYVFWPDKFRPDVAMCYDDSSNQINFLQLYVIAVQSARRDQHVLAQLVPHGPQGRGAHLVHERDVGVGHFMDGSV